MSPEVHRDIRLNDEGSYAMPDIAFLTKLSKFYLNVGFLP